MIEYRCISTLRCDTPGCDSVVRYEHANTLALGHLFLRNRAKEGNGWVVRGGKDFCPACKGQQGRDKELLKRRDAILETNALVDRVRAAETPDLTLPWHRP